MERRKQLKLNYKQTPTPMGVYQLANNNNNKIFIGSSLNLPGKKNGLLFQLRQGGYFNKELQADWNLHGADAFSFTVLEEVDPDKNLPETWADCLAILEQKWLDLLQPYQERGYNKYKRQLDN